MSCKNCQFIMVESRFDERSHKTETIMGCAKERRLFNGELKEHDPPTWCPLIKDEKPRVDHTYTPPDKIAGYPLETLLGIASLLDEHPDWVNRIETAVNYGFNCGYAAGLQALQEQLNKVLVDTPVIKTETPTEFKLSKQIKIEPPPARNSFLDIIRYGQSVMVPDDIRVALPPEMPKDGKNEDL